MVSIAIRALLLGAVLFQAAAPTPIRIGNVARQLSDQAMAELDRGFLAAGGKPWLIYGYERLPSRATPVYGIEGYLPAEVTTAVVRRGTVVNFSHQSGQPVKIGRSGRYAQVAVPDRSFDAIEGDRDINLPFLLEGEGNIDDADLIRIVTLVRSSPTLRSERVPGNWRIRSIGWSSGDSVEVTLSDGVSKEAFVALSRRNSNWVITQLGEVVH